MQPFPPTVPRQFGESCRVKCPFRMYAVYTALLALGLLISLPYWLFRMWRNKKYRGGLSERMGSVPARLARTSQPVIWIHAVSVGEVLAVSRLVTDIRRRLSAFRIVVSTTTATGQTLAR